MIDDLENDFDNVQARASFQQRMGGSNFDQQQQHHRPGPLRRTALAQRDNFTYDSNHVAYDLSDVPDNIKNSLPPPMLKALAAHLNSFGYTFTLFKKSVAATYKHGWNVAKEHLESAGLQPYVAGCILAAMFDDEKCTPVNKEVKDRPGDSRGSSALECHKERPVYVPEEYEPVWATSPSTSPGRLTRGCRGRCRNYAALDAGLDEEDALEDKGDEAPDGWTRQAWKRHQAAEAKESKRGGLRARPGKQRTASKRARR